MEVTLYAHVLSFLTITFLFCLILLSEKPVKLDDGFSDKLKPLVVLFILKHLIDKKKKINSISACQPFLWYVSSSKILSSVSATIQGFLDHTAKSEPADRKEPLCYITLYTIRPCCYLCNISPGTFSFEWKVCRLNWKKTLLLNKTTPPPPHTHK